MSNPEKTVNDVWKYFQCKKPKPKIVIRTQHRTALYWPDKDGLPFRHTITLRTDSWKNMTEAEKKLATIHESLHACGLPHQAGFRTSLDEVAHVVYVRLYGEDKDWKAFEESLQQKIDAVKKRLESK